MPSRRRIEHASRLRPLVGRALTLLLLVAGAARAVFAGEGAALEPIPDRLVVLTFDDASKSHFTVARPILLKHKFGATFFVTEGFDFPTNKRDYMSWEEIAQLHQDGFEIGNHTLGHVAVTDKSVVDLSEQLRGIEDRCQQHGIPRPVSFAYPGNAIVREAFPILREHGIRFARRGGAPEQVYEQGRGFAYEPGLDHPLLIPSAGDARPAWSLDEFRAAVQQARGGRIAVLQFHGVPDTAHSWVNCPRERFEEFMQHLADEKYQVIALRDLARYVDPLVAPNNHLGVIEDRRQLLESGQSGDTARKPDSDDEMRSWLVNMLVHHRFHPAEAGAALGMTADEVVATATRLGVDATAPAPPTDDGRLRVLPYPGGRHPRIGFRDGAIRPQRETKVSVFAPWSAGGYAVADTPEAVWFEPEAKKPQLLYLAHTHVPTVWDGRGVRLSPLEWTRDKGGGLSLERALPNRVTLISHVTPAADGARMEFRVTNGTEEKLTGLRVQMCVMLAGLAGFEQQTNDNKLFRSPFAACRDASGGRWVITGWERCGRAWGNPPCPCLHADPVVEDVPPGESRTVRGWLSFYAGDDIEAELTRLEGAAFQAR